MKRLLFYICCVFYFTSANVSAQNTDLRNTITSIIANKKATVGVAVIYNGTDTLTINNGYRYPTMSVYKFHLALAVLDYLNKHNLSLDHQLYVSKSVLHPDTHSPLRDQKPEGNFSMSIGELIQYSVSHSDNNACDLLFDFMGGTAPVELYIKEMGINAIAIKKTEFEMSENFQYQYDNWTTPYAAVQLMEVYRQQNLFAPVYKNFLWNALTETSTGNDKIRGLLPMGTVTGHKSGLSYRNTEGVRAADNDLGFIQLPNGNYLTVAVFIVNSVEDNATNASMIAQISKAAYDCYKSK